MEQPQQDIEHNNRMEYKDGQRLSEQRNLVAEEVMLSERLAENATAFASVEKWF